MNIKYITANKHNNYNAKLGVVKTMNSFTQSSMNETVDILKKTYPQGVKKRILKNKAFYFLLIPGMLYFVLFQYVPMYGALIAFQNYSPVKGFFGSQWVGMKNFIDFFSHPSFKLVLNNTLIISFYKLIFGFPAPIIFALLLNEVKNIAFKRTIQTITYLPHFLSWIVVAGLLGTLLSPSSGIINIILKSIGLPSIYFMADPKFFRSILVVSDIWKEVGWSSIIYIAAISNINPEMYEATVVDGANKWKQMIHVTIPSIIPTVVIMLILRVGNILNAGFEQIFIMYSPNVYNVSDIIDTFVYRMGLEQVKFSFATAVGLFKSLIGLILILSTNKIAKMIDPESGIW